MEQDIFTKFPLMTQWNDMTYWTGFLKANNTLIRLVLRVPNYPSIKSAVLEGDEDTLELIQGAGMKNQVMKNLRSDVKLLEFLNSFQDLMEKSIESKVDTSIQVWDPQIYSCIMNELQKIGFDNVPYLSKDLKEVHISQLDPSGRSHVIKFYITHMYPRKGLKVVFDLPVPPTEPIVWPNNILESVDIFKKNLDKYDKFWTEMDKIDESCQLLDPFKPNRSHTYRRILMGDKVILHMLFDPLNPKGFPTFQFFGPEKKTESFDDTVNKNCRSWSESRSVMENIEFVLEMTLPTKGTEVVSEDEVKCTICYMYELEGEGPESTCSCGSLFHGKCLYELFVNEAVDNIRKCVECPNCGRDIPVTTR